VQGKNEHTVHDEAHTYSEEYKPRRRGRSEVIGTFTTPNIKCVNDAHTHEPCIMASQALLPCNVLMKRARFGSVASAFAAPAVLIGGGSVTADSCGYGCGVWSSVGGGVASLGDGVGDGDNDSEGVEPLECYSRGKSNIKRKNTC